MNKVWVLKLLFFFPLVGIAQNTTPVYFKTWEATGASSRILGLSIGEDQRLYGYIDRFIYRYDGNRWIKMIEASGIRNVYLGAKQGLFVGKSGESNWYKPNANGTFEVIDLNSEVSKKALLPIHIEGSKDYIYFMGSNGVFAHKRGQSASKLEQIWKKDALAGCEAGNIFYVADYSNQLVKVQNKDAQLIVDINKTAAQISPMLFARCSADGSVLVKSATHQFFRYAPSSGLKPFSIQGLAPNVPVKWYRSLHSGGYVFLLDDLKIVQTDASGKIMQQWTQTDLKLDSPPTNIVADKQDRIWFVNLEGVGYIHLRTTFEQPVQAEPIASSGGLKKTFQDETNAYIITSEKILHRKLNEAWNAPFQPIYTSPKAIIGDASKGANGALWICDEREIVLLQNEAKTGFPPNLPCKSIAALRISPDRVWVGDEKGLRVIDKQGKVLATQNIPVNDLYVLSQNELLVQERKDKTDQFTKFKYDASGNIISTTRYPEFTKQFFSLDGIFQYNGKIFIYNTENVYRFERDNWVVATEIWQASATKAPNVILPTPDGKLWLVAEDRTGYFTVENGQYVWHALPYRLDKRNSANMLFALPDGSVILRSILGATARITPEAMKKPKGTIAVEVSSVFDHHSGKALYLGTKADLPASWTFSTDVSSLRFHFGHEEGAEAGIEYQTRLEGAESQWQAWNSDAERHYANLSGSYTLHVRMRDGYGRIAETKFSFYVYPPWYARWWALSLWALLLGFGGYYGFRYAVQYRTQQIEARNQELEAKVAERTEVIAQQAEELRSLDQAKTLFFGNVSHEFRTPLTLLLGWIQRLKKERIHLDSAEGSEALYQMQSQVKNLQGLINQIMDLTKIEAGRFELKKEALDMTAFVKRFVGTFQSLADYKEVKLLLETPSAPIPVWASMSALEQVLGNLLNNAIKFTDAGGEIKVHLQRQTDKTLSLSVADTGFGISPEDLPHIFERFYQAKDDRNKQGGGTGIGLALASDLVKLHEGTLSATSELNKGSTFTLVLPIMENAPQVLVEPAPASFDSRVPLAFERQDAPKADPNEDRARLLIIEDQADLRAFIRQMFEADYVVFEAENGEAGFEMAKSAMPDLVLCDVMMPKMNGFEVAEALQQNSETKGIPFLFLTARVAEEDMLHGLSLGAVDYILKPFDTEALRLKVHNLLEMVRRDSLSKRAVPPPETTTESLFQATIRTYVLERLADPNLTVDDLVAQLNLGRSVFYQQFKEAFGISPVVYIRTLRMEAALTYLKREGSTISEVAYQVGFNSIAYFTKTFREQYGKPPSAFLAD